MKYIISDIYDGKRRKLYSKICLVCNKEYFVPKHCFEKFKFCNVKCSGLHSRKQIKTVCANCGKEFSRTKKKLDLSKSKINFCSKKCKDEAQRIDGIKEIHLSHYNGGSTVYRDYAFRIKGKICNKCGYNKCEQMLDVHHIDCDRSNNTIENLEVLCVWCHAFETRKIDPHIWDGKI